MTEPAAGDDHPNTGIAGLRFDADGVLHLTWEPGVPIDAERAQAAMDRVNRLCGDRRAPLFIDMAGVGSLDRGGRLVFARPCAASAIALVGSSAVDRVLANFFLGVNSAPCPTRFFRSAETARAWLLKVGTDGTDGTDGGAGADADEEPGDGPDDTGRSGTNHG